ncbi:MAG: hypothetical protein GY780_07730 [bacterium]|nr:hypothetical protein [bacterium]
MSIRAALVILSLVALAFPAYSQFPVSTNQLGQHGEAGGVGIQGNVGSSGGAGEPSGNASTRNGGTGGTGGRGGSGGHGGDGGNGNWQVSANVTLAWGWTLQVGGDPGSIGGSGSTGFSGDDGGDGGFANWPGFAAGDDGDGVGGAGSGITGVAGEDGISHGGGGGGGSSGPQGFVQVMSNGGAGHGENAGTGYTGTYGDDGSTQVRETTAYIYINKNLQIGGNGGDGGIAGRGGCGGGGGGGAGGGGGWAAGNGGIGGNGGPGGSRGSGGDAGGGWFLILEEGEFSNHATISIQSNGRLWNSGYYYNSSSGSIESHGHLAVYQGVLLNNGIIISHNNDFSSTGHIINNGIITGYLHSSGVYEGTGNYEGNLVNSGIISPGPENSSGAMVLDHVDTSSGTILIHIGGTSADPLAYDQLILGGSIFLEGGTLKLDFLDGFDESDLNYGDYFDIIHYQEMFPHQFGTLDDTLAPLTNGVWELEYQNDYSAGWYSVRLRYSQDLSPVDETSVPRTFALENASPNPFNPLTTIWYSLPEASSPQFRVYDLAGRQVWESDDQTVLPAGRHSFVWQATDDNGQNLSSGSYLLRMTAKGFEGTQKLVLVR